MKTFTTHDIARFCDVTPSSVVHWINGGRLKSFQTPGGHHRVSQENLVAFLRSLDIPLPAELCASRARVLIVDDEADVTRVIEKAFARHLASFETEVCHDGVDALIRIGQNPPALVVLDLLLPKMDGAQVCRVLKAKPETRDIKIVVITGKRQSPTERKLEDIKVDAFLRKPLDLFELVSKSAELLKIPLESPVRK